MVSQHSFPPQGHDVDDVWFLGWPAIAKTWKSQIDTFSALGFKVVAPDMPGQTRRVAKAARTWY